MLPRIFTGNFLTLKPRNLPGWSLVFALKTCPIPESRGMVWNRLRYYSVECGDRVGERMLQQLPVSKSSTVCSKVSMKARRYMRPESALLLPCMSILIRLARPLPPV